MLFLVTVLIPLLLSPTALAQSSSSSVTAASPSSSGAANSTQTLEQIYNALLLVILAVWSTRSPSVSTLTGSQSSNYTGLLNFAASLPNSTEGQAVLDELVTGNKTLLVPSNEAFANLSQNVTNVNLGCSDSGVSHPQQYIHCQRHPRGSKSHYRTHYFA